MRCTQRRINHSKSFTWFVVVLYLFTFLMIHWLYKGTRKIKIQLLSLTSSPISLGFCGRYPVLLHQWGGTSCIANFRKPKAPRWNVSFEKCEANFGLCILKGAAWDSEEVEEMEAHSAPAQPAQAASQLHQPQWASSHTGVPAALLSRQPHNHWTPCAYCGDVI